eukprot:1685065-Alexandrium_andersonii.AAC.1
MRSLRQSGPRRCRAKGCLRLRPWLKAPRSPAEWPSSSPWAGRSTRSMRPRPATCWPRTLPTPRDG